MGWLRGIGGSVLETFLLSPAIMREGAVSFRHLVSVFALLDCVSPIIGCVEQLTGEPFGHRTFVALARCRNDPADAERLAARRAHFHRDLVCGAADAT